MIFDEIVVGSGLAALGVVLGLPAARRVMVIGGPDTGQFGYYGGALTKVASYLGHGGLGNYWHGGIPTGGRQRFVGASADSYQRLLHHFYPNTDVSERLGQPWLFNPWRPIRPRVEWCRLKAQRSDRLMLLHETVTRVTTGTGDVLVKTDRATHRARRVWVCAGALHTPALLDRSLETAVSRPFVSDHVFCYLGRIDRSKANVAPQVVQRTRDGLWFERLYDHEDRALYILRPARFAFKRLDHAITRRGAYGRPTGNAISNVLRGVSLGLFAEAIYNRTGLFPGSRMQSVYALVTVPDAHNFRSSDARISIRSEAVKVSVDDVRSSLPWPDIEISRRPEICIPSTHLYHSVDVKALARTGVNDPKSRLQVVDAAALDHIGPDHHTFRLMVAGYERAQALALAD